MVRSGAAVAVAMAVAAACTRGSEAAPEPAQPPPEPAAAAPKGAEVAWTARASADELQLTQTGEPPASCALEARRQGRVIWTGARCLAQRGQPVFLGPDGETVIVIDPFVPRGSGGAGIGPVVIVSRRGEVVRAFRASDLAPEERYELSDRWIASTELGLEHAPRLEAGGAAVRLETARGQVVTLRFDVVGPPAAKDVPVAGGRRDEPDPADEATLYRWKDAAGDVHYTVASDVPKDRARTASRVTAEVSSVALEPISGLRRTPDPAPAAEPPSGPRPMLLPERAHRTTHHVETLNSLPGRGVLLNADAMDRENEKQKRDMKCREVDGVTLCGG